MDFEVNIRMCLPRDSLSIPITRHVAAYAMKELGVWKESVADITLALTEACTNVLDHSTAEDSYEVRVTLDSDKCVITVSDTGEGFDHDREPPRVDPMAESGRGIALMRDLMDKLDFTFFPDRGLTVQLEKLLDFDEAHPVRRRVQERRRRREDAAAAQSLTTRP